MPKFVGATLDVGAVRAQNAATPTASNDLATKNYVDTSLQASGMIVQTRSWLVNGLSAGGNTGGLTTYFAYTGAISFSFTKKFAGTQVIVHGTTSGYASVAGQIHIGLNWPGTNLQIANFFFNAASTHATIGCMASITSLGAGTTTFAGEYATQSGLTFSADANDTWMLMLSEVWP